MQHWHSMLNDQLLPAVRHDQFWREAIEQFAASVKSRNSVHLAIFVEPYLQYVLDGKKTIESRFSTRRFAPYGQVDQGDIILLKKASGPIVGLCQVSSAWFYQLVKESLDKIKRDYAVELCAQDPEFWKEREGASFATLIRISNVLQIEPFAVSKRDRRGWVVLHSASQQMDFPMETV